MRNILIIVALCLSVAPAVAQEPTPTQSPAQDAKQAELERKEREKQEAKAAKEKAKQDAKSAKEAEAKADQSQTVGEKVGMAGAEQAVNGRVSAFLDALRKGDEAALASIYADDYTVTTDTGTVQTKAQRLEWVKANAARLTTIDFQDLKTRVYGDTAVVTGRATSTASAINSRIIQVWIQQGGTWRLVAGQNTPIGP